MRKLTRRAAAIVVGGAVAAGAVAAFAQVPGPAAPPGAPPSPAPPVGPAPGALPPPASVAPPVGPSTPAAPPAAGLPAPKPEVRPTGTAATVNGQPIPEVAVYRALRQYPANMQEQARKEIIAHLVENLLIDQYLNAIKVTVTEPDVEKLINELKDELTKAKKNYDQELEAMLLTKEEFRAEVVAQMKWEEFVKKQGTDVALKQLFETSPDVFDGSMVRASHILMTPGNDQAKQQEAAGKLRGIKQVVEQEAAKVVAALPATADANTKEAARVNKTKELFAAYAKEYSQCPSKKDGGDLNFFPRAGAMVEPFAKAAYDTKQWQMTDVVATEFGYHLILVTDRKAGMSRKFEEVKEDVRMLYAMRLREAVIAQMKPKAQITINAAPAPAGGAAPMTPAVPGKP